MEGIDRTKELNLLKTARGQMDGIIKMLEEGRYCIDISKQVLAVQALLKKADSRTAYASLCNGCL